MLGALVCSSITYGQLEFQQSRRATTDYPSNIQRYGYDYIVNDYTFPNGDSSILELINLDQLESSRRQDVNVVETDAATGLSITLIAYNKIGRKPKNTLDFKE